MDLIQTLRKSLSTIEGLSADVKIGYMVPDDAIGVYPLPGSTTLDEDWAGNKTKRMNYEVSIRTKNQQLANSVIWKISDYLEQLDHLESADGSFEFKQIDQNGLPSLIEQDAEGNVVYMLDFYVEIVTNNRK